ALPLHAGRRPYHRPADLGRRRRSVSRLTHARHRVSVDLLAIAQGELLVRALDDEAELLVELYRGLIVGEDSELEPRKIEPVVGNLDQRLHERGADAFRLPLVVHREADMRGVAAPGRFREQIKPAHGDELAFDARDERIFVLPHGLEALLPHLLRWKRQL